MNKNPEQSSFRFTETPFNLLMHNRIHQVLLITSEYDAFTLEEDGRIEEQLFNEYISLNLHHPPRIINARTAKEALKILNSTYIDLIVTMINIGDKQDVFEFAKSIKEIYPTKPIVVLTPFSREVTLRLSHEDLSSIDYVFSWLGHADIMLAIIKLIEDKMNVDDDIRQAGVQCILLVEDSIRYYSSYLPNMYKITLQQAKVFMQEGLNEHRQMQRMRGRPKILLARNYEQAEELYEKYKNNLLGIISDTKYPRNGELDSLAGVKFFQKVKEDDKFIPLLLQSSNQDNRKHAEELGVGFLHKYSESLSRELRDFMNEYFAFGAFRFINPQTGQTIAKAEDLHALYKRIDEISNESFEYHITRNHLSKWLNARALFPIAELFRHVAREDFSSINQVKEFVKNAIVSYRKSTSRGIIAKFNKDNYDETLIFSRIGDGYIGGKARGLAFLDVIIKKNRELENYKGVTIRIPRTVVLSTEIFDRFLEHNSLYSIALSNEPDEKILNAFISASLPNDVIQDLKEFLKVASNPIAVRSSSLLEDSHYQPFAGVYSTYMIPNSHHKDELNLLHLQLAVKSVYASVYFRETKAYMSATSNVIDEEKMAIVLQEVCGTQYNERFYPSFSGVLRSINFYPIELEKPEDGIVTVALGLGKHIVEGKQALRFSPKYPKKILQLSSPAHALNDTQKTFEALDLNPDKFSASIDEGINIKTFTIKDAENDGSISNIASVYDLSDNVIKEGSIYKGKRIITFSNILKHDNFPLADILQKIMRICSEAMNSAVEIEFAVDLTLTKNKYPIFNLLQIRPIAEQTPDQRVDLDNIENKDTIISSNSALGDGIIREIYDIVYVKPETFNSANNLKIVDFIDELNRKFAAEKRNYILIGPGRWGSSDSWLGIPVKWANISSARLIIESGLENYRIDPSQGTHFFQNLTSFRVGYFTINPYKKDGFYDIDFLSKQPTVYENEFIRHVKFEEEIVIKIDGKKSKGVVMKPGK